LFIFSNLVSFLKIFSPSLHPLEMKEQALHPEFELWTFCSLMWWFNYQSFPNIMFIFLYVEWL